jgi:Ca2+-binding RTX toxin-like protein
MKRLLASAGILAAVVLAAPVGAAVEPVVTAPTQCAGMTFDHTFTVANGQSVKGTAGRDLIVAGDANSVDGKGGNDCIVVGSANTVKGGDGDDTIVANGSANALAGNGDDDHVWALAGSNKLEGNGGADYLDAVGSAKLDGGAGIDECHSDAKLAKQVGCEPAVLSAVAKALGL